MARKRCAAHAILSTARWEEKDEGRAFAPANIALCKYWGKRDVELHLPTTSSLSLSLPLGTETVVRRSIAQDSVRLQGRVLASDDPVYKRLTAFLDILRPNPEFFFSIETHNTVPIAAGLASSASGFGALVLALSDFFGWNISRRDLSILARLGSGSASRSIDKGFVLWHRGNREDGSDSFAEPIDSGWHDLRIGVLLINTEQKRFSSGTAMERTMATSPLYPAWVEASSNQIIVLRQALAERNFEQFGQIAEANAMGMHATMLGAVPGLSFWHPETVATILKIWNLRENGLSIYCTLDAGPNIKVLFLARDENIIRSCFNDIEIYPTD